MKYSCCIFSAQYLPHVGGVEMFTYNLGRNLSKMGIKVTIVTSKSKDTPYYEVNKDGVEIYRMPSFQFMNSRFPVLKKGKKTDEIESELKEHNFNFVVINTRFYPLSTFGAKFAYKNGIDSVVIEHGTDYLTFNNPVLDSLDHIYEHMITNRIKKYCKNFCGVSRACGEWLKTFGIEQSDVVYNAIDCELLNSMLASEDCFRDLSVPSKDIICCFVGRIVEEKGIRNLIEAVNDINCSSDVKIHLFIAGDGNLMDEILKYQSEYVKILGSISLSKVISLMSASDVFCLPSKSEGFPTTVLEAVYSKCFVITTEKGGAKELIDSDDLGKIISDNSAETIKKAFLSVIGDKSYMEAATQKAREKLLDNFTWPVVANRFAGRYILNEEK